jgi:hypothetical protein
MYRTFLLGCRKRSCNSQAACWRFIWGVEKGLKSKPLLWAKQYKTFFGGSLLEIHLGSGKGA